MTCRPETTGVHAPSLQCGGICVGEDVVLAETTRGVNGCFTNANKTHFRPDATAAQTRLCAHDCGLWSRFSRVVKVLYGYGL